MLPFYVFIWIISLCLIFVFLFVFQNGSIDDKEINIAVGMLLAGESLNNVAHHFNVHRFHA